MHLERVQADSASCHCGSGFPRSILGRSRLFRRVANHQHGRALDSTAPKVPLTIPDRGQPITPQKQRNVTTRGSNRSAEALSNWSTSNSIAILQHERIPSPGVQQLSTNTPTLRVGGAWRHVWTPHLSIYRLMFTPDSIYRISMNRLGLFLNLFIDVL